MSFKVVKDHEVFSFFKYLKMTFFKCSGAHSVSMYKVKYESDPLIQYVSGAGNFKPGTFLL